LYNNYQGLYAFQLNDENNSKVMIEDVISKNIEEYGMYLTGTGITVNNANIRDNDVAGLVIGNNIENEITLAGDVSITNNVYGFAVVPAAQGTVRVTGNLISNHNEYGVAAFSSESFTLAVGGSNSGKAGKSGSGSLTACDNTLDIYGPSTFEGSDYTCDNDKTFGDGVPDCKPCYPGCPSPSPSPSPSESAEFSETQQIASSMAEDLDLVATAMDMEYLV
jgi:hypothetical protein